MSLKYVLNTQDFRKRAQKRLPKMVFDYIDGGADDEVSLVTNETRYRDYQLSWKSLVDVSKVDYSTELFGDKVASPLVISPTAASRLFHPKQGERAVARAASEAGIVYSLSTLGSVPIEEIAQITAGPKWFQIYVWRDRSLVESVIERVKKAGFKALILTVDVPVAGNRERDPKNSFTIPPKVNPRTVRQAIIRPRYLWDVLTSPEIGPANFPKTKGQDGIIDILDNLFDRSVTWDYVKWLRSIWDGPIVIKGISRAKDAVIAVDSGADAIWLSNHGGRQLDTARPSIDTLQDVRQAIGEKTTIILDGGVRRGTDVIKAIALGANAVAIGRPYLFALAADGYPGVKRILELMHQELERDLALMGAPNLNSLSEDLVTIPSR